MIYIFMASNKTMPDITTLRDTLNDWRWVTIACINITLMQHVYYLQITIVVIGSALLNDLAMKKVILCKFNISVIIYTR